MTASVGANDTPVGNGLLRGSSCSDGVGGFVGRVEVGGKEFREEKRCEETDLPCLYDILHGLKDLVIPIAPSSAYENDLTISSSLIVAIALPAVKTT